MSGDFPPFSTTIGHEVRVINRSRWVIIYSSTCWLCTFHWCESTCWLSTSHESVRQHGNSTYCPPLMVTPHWLNTLYMRYVTASTAGMTSQRWHPVTRVWPISRSEWLIDLTYIQVRVIDWHVTVLVTGHLAADGGTSGVTSHGDVTWWRHRGDTWWRHRKYVISRDTLLIDTWRKLL